MARSMSAGVATPAVLQRSKHCRATCTTSRVRGRARSTIRAPMPVALTPARVIWSSIHAARCASSIGPNASWSASP